MIWKLLVVSWILQALPFLPSWMLILTKMRLEELESLPDNVSQATTSQPQSCLICPQHPGECTGSWWTTVVGSVNIANGQGQVSVSISLITQITDEQKFLTF